MLLLCVYKHVGILGISGDSYCVLCELYMLLLMFFICSRCIMQQTEVTNLF